MGVSATWTVFCDECGNWVSEQPTKELAKRAAVDAGFARLRMETGSPFHWVCPADRDDVCGAAFTYTGAVQATEWCLRPPDHEGKHSWQR